MSKWQFSFPPSRTCLWDGTAINSPSELYLTRNSWVHVCMSSATLQLAVRHARQSRRKLFDCFLIATAWITEGEGIALEVDRFDPGRPSQSGSGLSPTSLIPGDIPVPSQITVNSHPEAKYLTHNLETLRHSIASVQHSLTTSTATLDPSLLLSLRIHCTCLEDGTLDVECACVYPGEMIIATPIKPIAIVQTALARNLSGPLSLSTIQGRSKHGFVTMEASRKLILLLHSDPKAVGLPLVGVWVSGVGSVYHPVVWMACVTYIHSTTLTDRVWGEDGSFVMLVYLEGSTKPIFSQCIMKKDNRSMELVSGENSLPVNTVSAHLSFDLYPVQESTALHTLMETVITSAMGPCSDSGPRAPAVHTLMDTVSLGPCSNSSPRTIVPCDLIPVPSPQPTPTQVPPKLARDSELSMVSCLSLSDEGHSSSTTPHASPVTCKSHDSSSHGTLDNKENILLSHTNISGSKEVTPTNQTETSRTPLGSVCESQFEGSLVVFPSKVGMKMTPQTANTRRLLKEQELQLKALQEQVNTLLRAQSQSPTSPSINTTPKVEASTSTGESLYWPHLPPHSLSTPSQTRNLSTQSTHSTPSQTHDLPGEPSCSTPSQLHHLPSQSTHSTPSYLPTQSTRSTPPLAHTHTSTEKEESLCSSIVSRLSVETATSTLSQSMSDMHLDLHSYHDAQSLSPPLTPSFGDSASVVEDQPVNTRHQQQLYQNMLSTINALLSSQEDDAQSQSQFEAPSSTHHHSQHHSNISNHTHEEISHSTRRQSVNETINYSTKDVSTQERGCHILSNTSSISTKTQSSQSSNLPHHPEPIHFTEFPYLHPDVIQQHYRSEVSLLPVPRIISPLSNINSTLDTAVYPQGSLAVSGSDCTLDENMQLADMIAMKYLGGKTSVELQDSQHTSRQPLLVQASGTGEVSSVEMYSAHMSMATRQYLQRHKLLDGHGGKSPHNTLYREDSLSHEPGDNILNIKRLKKLPKLI